MPRHLLRKRDATPPIQVEKSMPTISRDEYHRLLTAAKEKRDERAYLLVKLFALTGLNVQELPQVTVETAKASYLTVITYNTKRVFSIPPALAQDLKSYAARNGITTGPVFLQSDGTPLQRLTATYMIRGLAKDANVAPEKCNPRALRYLFQALKTEAEDKFRPMVEETLRRQLEEEQMEVGWEND